jgi:hypothetical protein
MRVLSGRERTGVACALPFASRVPDARTTDVTLGLHAADGQPGAVTVYYAKPSGNAAPAVKANTRALIDQVHEEFAPMVLDLRVAGDAPMHGAIAFGGGP